MSHEDPGGLAATLSRLEALAEHPDDRACEEAVRAVMAALPFLRLAPMGTFLDGLRRLRARVRRERRPDTQRIDGMLLSLEILCEEHDRAIAHMICPRCGRHHPSSHVMMRTLRPGEERACAECKEKRLDQGWSLLSVEPVDSWCFGCRSRKKPMYCVGPSPDPMVLRVCDPCADELRAAGWRGAVSITHSF